MPSARVDSLSLSLSLAKGSGRHRAVHVYIRLSLRSCQGPPSRNIRIRSRGRVCQCEVRPLSVSYTCAHMHTQTHIRGQLLVYARSFRKEACGDSAHRILFSGIGGRRVTARRRRLWPNLGRCGHHRPIAGRHRHNMGRSWAKVDQTRQRLARFRIIGGRVAAEFASSSAGPESTKIEANSAESGPLKTLFEANSVGLGSTVVRHNTMCHAVVQPLAYQTRPWRGGVTKETHSSCFHICTGACAHLAERGRTNSRDACAQFRARKVKHEVGQRVRVHTLCLLGGQSWWAAEQRREAVVKRRASRGNVLRRAFEPLLYMCPQTGAGAWGRLCCAALRRCHRLSSEFARQEKVACAELLASRVDSGEHR